MEMLARRHRLRIVVAVALLALVVPVVLVGVGTAGAADPSDRVVYVATGENFPDALAAAPAAALGRAPILLVAKDSIPSATAAELTRLDPDRIVIVGGTGVVSAAVEAALGAYAPTVERLAGADRYATAAEISKAAFPQGHPMVEYAIVEVTNLDFTSQQTLATITMDIPAPGEVVVRFDGYAGVSDGDRLVLAATNTGTWGANSGNVAVYGDNGSEPIPFSHTRVYTVTPGTQSFQAVGERVVRTGGTGIASVYGTLTVQYYPDTP